VWDQLLELPCYSPPRVGPSARLPMLLTAKLIKPGAMYASSISHPRISLQWKTYLFIRILIQICDEPMVQDLSQ
jgi:hypothetical protein